MQHTCLNFHSCSCSDSLCFNGSLKRSESMRELGSMLSCCCCLFMESFDICTLLMRKAALLSLAFCWEKIKKCSQPYFLLLSVNTASVIPTKSITKLFVQPVLITGVPVKIKLCTLKGIPDCKYFTCVEILHLIYMERTKELLTVEVFCTLGVSVQVLCCAKKA